MKKTEQNYLPYGISDYMTKKIINAKTPDELFNIIDKIHRMQMKKQQKEHERKGLGKYAVY